MISSPVEIIAELANAHQGQPEQALILALDCLAAGADAVKFQIYSADELLVRAHPRYEHFKRQSFDRTTWLDIIGKVKAAGGRVYCDVFGLDAVSIAAEAGADGIKVHSSDLGNGPMIEAVGQLGKRVLLSTGGSTAREIAFALRTLKGRSHGLPVLLHGYQSYPTAVEDSRLERLGWLNSIFGSRAIIGYQDHVAGDDPFATLLPVLALGLGARVIEKHVTLDRAAKGVDYYSSIEPAQLKEFIAVVRRAESAFGTDPETFAEPERQYRRTVKKHWVTKRALPAGHLLTPGDMVMKRVPDDGAETVEPEKLLGRRLLADVGEEHPLTRADVKNIVWAVVVARIRSARLPGKALLDVAGMPALQHLFERLKQAESVDRIVFCTTTEAEDDPLARVAQACDIPFHRGPVEDVLGRMLGALAGHEVDLVLRVTGDDILVDPDYTDRAVAHHLSVNAEYSDLKALPSGTEVEVFDAELLRTIHRLAADPDGTEYLTNYVTAHADQMRVAQVPVDPEHAFNWRLTIDTPEDYEVVGAFLAAMKDQGKALTYRLDDVVAYFHSHPKVLAANAHVRQRQKPISVQTDLRWGQFV